MLNRKQILEADDIKTEAVPVPEWGGDVLVKSMTGTERDAFEQGIIGGKEKVDMKNIRARLCAASIIDDKGVPVFSEDDIESLGKKNAAALDKVFAVAQRLSGIGKDDVDDLAKNSGAAQSGDSTSD